MEFNLNLLSSVDLLHDYLRGVLWTIFFTRLFGPLIPLHNSNFLDTVYPTADYPDLDELIESKINSIINELSKPQQRYQEQQDTSRATTPGSGSGSGPGSGSIKVEEEPLIYKCVIVIKFYEKSVVVQASNPQSISSSTSSFVLQNPHSYPTRNNQLKYSNCWEKWQLKLSILNATTEFNQSLPLSKQTPEKINSKLSNLSVKERFDFFQGDFEKNMFEIIDYVDENKSHIPGIHSTAIAPFPYVILFGLNTLDPNSLNASFQNLEENSDSPGSESSPNVYRTNTGDASQESLEYITTTEAGDVIMSSSSSQHGGTSQGKNRPIAPGEDLLRNGYKFFKKFLE